MFFNTFKSFFLDEAFSVIAYRQKRYNECGCQLNRPHDYQYYTAERFRDRSRRCCNNPIKNDVTIRNLDLNTVEYC